MESGNKIAQDKLKLLYILEFINIPLTNIEITNYILENNYMDYFSLQQLLGNLCNSKFIRLNSKNGNEYYKIAEAGKEALEMFGDILPEYFKEEVNLNFSHLKKELKRQRELLGHYYKSKEDIFIVNLQVTENETVIFNLSINVPTENLAKNICKKWDSNPEEIFGSIIKTLTTDLN
jgi:predicted transcriptional regulator